MCMKTRNIYLYNIPSHTRVTGDRLVDSIITKHWNIHQVCHIRIPCVKSRHEDVGHLPVPNTHHSPILRTIFGSCNECYHNHPGNFLDHRPSTDLEKLKPALFWLSRSFFEDDLSWRRQCNHRNWTSESLKYGRVQDSPPQKRKL